MSLVNLGGRAVASLFSTARLQQVVEAHGIVVFVGPNGSGKSLAAVASVLPALKGQKWTCWDQAHQHHWRLAKHLDECPECGVGWLKAKAMGADPEKYPCDLCDEGMELAVQGSTGERQVYSTVELLDDIDPHPRYHRLEDYRQLLTIEHADVLFDEVAGVSDSSDSSSIPVLVVQWLHTLRKRDVRLRVTTPAYERCSKPIRQVAQVVVDCRSYLPERNSGALWRPRRLMRLRAYDAFEFDAFTVSTENRLGTMASGFFWRPGSEASVTYSTLAQVAALGHVTEHGMCLVCGGQRSRPRCACPGHVESPDDYVVTETVSKAGARTRSLELKPESGPSPT